MNEGWLEWIKFSLAIIGGLFLFYVFVIAGHELGHILDVKKQGTNVTEVCILGWNGRTNAWVKGEGDINRSFSNWWDYPWK